MCVCVCECMPKNISIKLKHRRNAETLDCRLEGEVVVGWYRGSTSRYCTCVPVSHADVLGPLRAYCNMGGVGSFIPLRVDLTSVVASSTPAVYYLQARIFV